MLSNLCFNGNDFVLLNLVVWNRSVLVLLQVHNQFATNFSRLALDQDDSVKDKYFEQIFIKKEDIFDSQTTNILSNFVQKRGYF